MHAKPDPERWPRWHPTQQGEKRIIIIDRVKKGPQRFQRKFFTASITAASRLVYYHDALQQVACSSAFIPFMNGTSLLGTTSGRSLTRSLLILEFNRRNCDFIFQTGLFPCHQFSLLGVPNRKLVTIINQWPNNLLAKQKVKKKTFYKVQFCKHFSISRWSHEVLKCGYGSALTFGDPLVNAVFLMNYSKRSLSIWHEKPLD